MVGGEEILQVGLDGDPRDERRGQAERHQDRFSLLMIDLNRFKHVNDYYGHPTGDQVLSIIGDRLQQRRIVHLWVRVQIDVDPGLDRGDVEARLDDLREAIAAASPASITCGVSTPSQSNASGSSDGQKIGL